ncbi:MAG TPA: AmmeMemoRadiSam system protein B, partial [Candidatus Limnocylindria bacterium]|nr:AmmeMemoRadiSam system protein B [Candidatus Limnocylindria bacterium]
MPHFPKNYFIRVQFIVFIFVQQQVYPHTCHSPLSDLWYPHSSAQLRSMLVALYDKAANHYDASVPATAIRAVVVPHAGYAYSGEVAASVYRLLQGSSFKRVIILGPLHTRSFTGIAVPSCTTYATPLGSLSLDTKVLKALSHNALFVYNDALFLQEHSLDVQLPFVYKSMPSCKIVPLLVGTLSYQQIEQTVQALMPYIDATTLVVVSSDFVHYGKRFSYEPFKTQQAGLAESIMHLNAQALHFLPYGTVQDFLQFIDATQATICGALPLAILIALKKAGVFQNGSSHLISYATSADKGDDATGQVSYVGLVLSDTGLPRDTELVFLTQYEKKSLLQLARSVIEQAFVKKVPRALLYPII